MSDLTLSTPDTPALVRLLFPDPSLDRSAPAIVRWWERRRLVFNLVVGGTGLVTLGVVELLLGLAFGEGPIGVPWPIVAAYGILANVCYSFGAVAELAVQRWLRRPTYGLGPALWRHGLVSSVGLTLFPIAIAAIGFLADRLSR